MSHHPPAMREPVPFEAVEKMAEHIRGLQALQRDQQALQAQMIRWCVRAINQTTEQAARTLEREQVRKQKAGERYQPVRFSAPSKKVRDDKLRAMLQLEWLATTLENQSVGLPDNNLSKGIDHVHGCESV